jgi:thiol-disulfide isomerase/thioredoxin
VGLGANPEANEPKPKVISHGEKVDLKDHLVPGQTMIFDFYSHFCPPCRAISPQLEKLDEARKDLTVIRVDINRPGQFEIDWESPVAKQYHLSSVPYFRIYGPKGTLQSEGEEARAQVDQWIAEVPEAAAAQESSGDFEDLGKAVEQVGQELAKGLEKMGEQMGQALQEGQKGMEQADDAFAKMMGGMAGKLKFTVHFPGPVLEVDPAGTKEGNTARWEFPLMTLMTGGDVVMKATAQAPFSWLPVEVGAGVVFLLIVLGVARRMARGRRSYTPA